jgi:hypothetical protein
MNREQSTKKGSTKNKPSKAEVENLALMLAGVIAHPAIPPALRQHIREGVTELFNGLGHHPDAQNNVTDSPEYLTLLFMQHAERSEGGATK